MRKTFRLLAWLISGCAAFLLLTMPVSVQAQFAMSVAVIAIMTAIWLLGRGGLARWTFLALASLVVCRYIFWRLTSTLPPIDQPVNFGLGLLLVGAELYCVLILVTSLIINADPLERPDLAADLDADLPTVDVFIPSYNEDEIILATTIAAAKSLDYPAAKLKVWLLDDGGTDQKCADRDPVKAAAAKDRRKSLQKLCDSLGALYLTRARNEHAKAGNLNNGLENSDGAIIAVFDADHAPFRTFLRETAGHFRLDPKLFLVQTPHVFLNPDPIERNLKTFDRMPSENEMFYSETQRGLDKWNGSFFCGSAALLRREALDVTGGFSGITITEDCETAFDLHSKGWTSVYVNKPLIAGLQPETLESFIGQRSRWCQGMFQLLLLKNPLFCKGLAPIQKLAYLSSMIFWLFPLPRLVFTIAPLLHIFFDVKIFVSSMDEAMAYTATYIVVNVMLQNYLYGRVRWPFMSELYEYIQGVYLAKAIVAVALSPRSPSFNVTQKGITLENDHLSGLAWPFFAIFGILALGAGTAFYRYAFEPGAELMLIVGLWTSFNLIVAGAALGVVAERREPDRFPRLPIERRGHLNAGGRDISVSIVSVSAGGCSLRVGARDAPLIVETGKRYNLTVEPIAGQRHPAPLQVELVRSTTDKGFTTYGFVFADMKAESYLTLAGLMYGDPQAMQRFLTKRRTHKNLFGGFFQFMIWAGTEPLRAFTYAIKRQSASGPTTTTIAPTAVPELTVEIGAALKPTEASHHVQVASTEGEPPSASINPVGLRIAAIAHALSTGAPLTEVATAPTASSIEASTVFDLLVRIPTDGSSGQASVAAKRADEIRPTEWLHAVLALAANESAIASNEETADAATSIAA